MKSTVRPFQHIRYEYEQRHIYYLPPNVMLKLDAAKPAYLFGTRGTGKTTLLKALEWKERLFNKSLHRQLGQDVFAARYIGAYLKLPLFLLQTLEEKLPTLFPTGYAVIIGLYIDLITLQPLCIAMSELASRGILHFSPSEEHECVGKILKNHSFLRGEEKGGHLTLRMLKDALYRVQRLLEKAVLYDKTIGEDIIDGISTIGGLGRSCAAELGLLCNRAAEETPWHFKICLDEAESLGTEGRKVLNTIVRTSEVPLIHVAAFVGVPGALVETFNSSLTLADEDRSLIPLDQVTNQDFLSLAEGVASARIQEATGDSSKVVVLERILGSIDLERMAVSILAESVNPEAKALLKTTKDKNSEGVLTSFLQLELKREAPPESAPYWEKRRNDSSFRRKAMVAAYLGLCNRLGISPRYASADMVIGMSDHCIRDFLRFINEIYIESEATADSFCDLKISPRIQDVAIKRASKIKVDCLTESGVHEPIPTRRLIDGLAKMTTVLQTTGRENANYRSPERGIFVIAGDPALDSDLHWLTGLVRDAAEAGFMIVRKSGPKKWIFRIHTSLAANYGFSYRGAYYETTIQAKDLVRIARAEDQETSSRVVKELGQKMLAGEASETPLFDMSHD
jgi:hypothetical protein